MDARTLAKLKKDLTSFLDDVAGTLGNPRRRRWCESYLRGVLLDGHRKSIEPMAARLKVIERGEHDYEQGLQQFLNQSPWDEQDVLDGLQHWIARQFGTEGSPTFPRPRPETKSGLSSVSRASVRPSHEHNKRTKKRKSS